MSEKWIIRDIPLVKLYPFRKRRIPPYQELCMKASIVHYGLQEPLIVFPEDDDLYCILDGHVRYAALKELGYISVPCRFQNSEQRR